MLACSLVCVAWNAVWPMAAVAASQTERGVQATAQDAGNLFARSLENARQALEKETPGWVVRDLLPVWESGGGEPAQRLQMRLFLGEAWMDLGEWERALKILSEGFPEEGAATEWGKAAMLRGRSLIRMGRVDEAAVVFEQAAQAGADPGACALGRACCLREFGRGEEARRLLEDALQKNPDHRFPLGSALAAIHLDAGNWSEANRCLRLSPPRTHAEQAVFEWGEARLWCLEGRFAEAAPRLSSLMESTEKVDAEVRLGALFALAQGLRGEGRTKEAIALLAGALDKNWAAPRAAVVLRVWFGWLGPLDSFGESELKRLKKREQSEVAGWASFYLGKSYAQTGKKTQASEEWDTLLRENPRHPAVARIWASRASAAWDAGQSETAAHLFSEGLAVNTDLEFGGYLQMRLGQVRYEMGDFGGALNAFEAAWRSGPRWSVEAAFNAGLSAVRMQALRKGSAWLERLRRAQGAEAFGDRLELELAIEQAREGGAGAEDAVRAILKKKMEPSSRSALMLSLAEWSVHRTVQSARDPDSKQGGGISREKALRAVDALRPVADVAPENMEYLRVLVECSDRSRKSDSVQELIEGFLRQFPGSPLAGEVCFLWGENLYRSGDYSEAEERFLKAAEMASAADLREFALYVAGQCAARSQDSEATGRALIHWDAVAQMGGRLRWKARYQQASLKCHMGEEREGVLLYDLLLKASAELDPELAFAARCGRADALLSLARRSRESTDAALGEYRALAVVAQDALFWKTQALYKAAKAREETAPDEALSSLRELITFPDNGKKGEDFWVYRAGFDAARILEKRKEWGEAVGVYESLERRKGSGANEAAARARQLRLENFLWND
jgi:tetratricopeptide (TPR) repeat protein